MMQDEGCIHNTSCEIQGSAQASVPKYCKEGSRGAIRLADAWEGQLKIAVRRMTKNCHAHPFWKDSI
jgi:hypothetical protein